ncbi:Hypothetical predicted protein, partial [Pelobates cultripes]
DAGCQVTHGVTGLLWSVALAAPGGAGARDAGMGQEACKSAWPKPAGGYQTITGRRYGRRHAYVSFRPSLESPNRTSSQQSRDCEGLELDDVQKENPLILEKNCDSSIFSFGSLSSNCPEETRRTDSKDGISVLTEVEQNGTPHFAASEQAKDCHSLSSGDDCMNSSKIHIMHAPVKRSQQSHQNGISFVNIDSFEPDSSEGEENIFLSEEFSLTKEKGKPPRTLNSMLSELEKECFSESRPDSSRSSHSYAKDSLSVVCPVSLSKYKNRSPDHAQWNVSMGEATGDTSIDICEIQQKKSKADIAAINTVAVYHELNPNNTQLDLGTEPVVRPKIRKQVSSSPCTKMNLLRVENEGKENSKQGNWDSQVRKDSISVDEKSRRDRVFDPIDFDGASDQIRTCSKDLEHSPLHDKSAEDDAFWDDFKFYGVTLTGSNKDEDR